MPGAKVHIRKNETGEINVYEDDYWSGDFQWQEGNYCCDCNRRLFFERAGGTEPEWDDEDECSKGLYDVVKVEFHEGGEHPDPSIFNQPKRTPSYAKEGGEEKFRINLRQTIFSQDDPIHPPRLGDDDWLRGWEANWLNTSGPVSDQPYWPFSEENTMTYYMWLGIDAEEFHRRDALNEMVQIDEESGLYD